MPSIYGRSKLNWEMCDPHERTQIENSSSFNLLLVNEIRGKIRFDVHVPVLVFFKNLDHLNRFKNSEYYSNLKCHKQELTEQDSLSDREEKGSWRSGSFFGNKTIKSHFFPSNLV